METTSSLEYGEGADCCDDGRGIFCGRALATDSCSEGNFWPDRLSSCCAALALVSRVCDVVGVVDVDVVLRCARNGRRHVGAAIDARDSASTVRADRANNAMSGFVAAR